MARGITEAQVHAAADALVAAGERPTVERIRAHLGSGSPNTVTRLLDSWWAGLGRRLTARSRIALEAPDVVQRLVGDLWEEAIAAGREHAQASLAVEHEALRQARASLAADHAQATEAVATASHAREAADQARTLAEARLVEAQRRADQLQAQLADVTEQRAALSAAVERLERDRADLATQLHAAFAAAGQERETQAAHVRAVEDRAHAEVDRARQEAQELRAQLRSAARDHATEQATARAALQQAQGELAIAQRELARLTGRLEALEAPGGVSRAAGSVKRAAKSPRETTSGNKRPARRASPARPL
jgi:hypothetical protein